MQKGGGGKGGVAPEEVTRRGLRSSALSIYHPAEGKMYFLFYIYFNSGFGNNLSLKRSDSSVKKQWKTFVIRWWAGRRNRKIEKYARVGKKFSIITHWRYALWNSFGG